MTPDAIDDLIESTCRKVNAGRTLSLNHIGLMLDAIKAQRSEIDRLRAKVEAGDALAEAVRHEREPVVCQDYNMQTQAHEAVGRALTAYREAGQ